MTNPDAQSDTLAGGFVYEPVVTLTLVPVAGPLDAGSTQSVTWVSLGIANLLIELSRDGGSSWEVIVASTPAAAGSYAWDVTGPGSVDCLLRISDAFDGDPWDESGAVFTIAEIAVTSPAGGEVWLPGSLQSITWQAFGVASVKIEVTRNGGTSWGEIAASTDAAAGSYAWFVTGPESAYCRIRVSDAVDGVPAGVSPAEFRIGPPDEAYAAPFLGDGCVGGRPGTPASSPVLIGTWLLCLAYTLRKRVDRPLSPGMAEEA